MTITWGHKVHHVISLRPQIEEAGCSNDATTECSEGITVVNPLILQVSPPNPTHMLSTAYYNSYNISICDNSHQSLYIVIYIHVFPISCCTTWALYCDTPNVLLIITYLEG